MKAPKCCNHCKWWEGQQEQGCTAYSGDESLCIDMILRDYDSLSAEVEQLKKEAAGLAGSECALEQQVRERDSRIKILETRLQECDSLFEPFDFAKMAILFEKAAEFLDSEDAELRIIGDAVNNIIIYLENRNAGQNQLGDHDRKMRDLVSAGNALMKRLDDWHRQDGGIPVVYLNELKNFVAALIAAE